MHFQRAKRLATAWIDGLAGRQEIAEQIRSGNLSRNVTTAAFSDRGLRRFACRMLGTYRDSILAIEQVQWGRARKILRVRLACADDVHFSDGGPGFTERCACFFDFIFLWTRDWGWHPPTGCLAGSIGRHCLMRLVERNLPNDTIEARLSDREVIDRIDEMARAIGPSLSEASRIARLALSLPGASPDPAITVPFDGGLLLGIVLPTKVSRASANSGSVPNGRLEDGVPLHIRTFCDRSLLSDTQNVAYIDMVQAIRHSRECGMGATWVAGMSEIVQPVLHHLITRRHPEHGGTVNAMIHGSGRDLANGPPNEEIVGGEAVEMEVEKGGPASELVGTPVPASGSHQDTDERSPG